MAQRFTVIATVCLIAVGGVALFAGFQTRQVEIQQVQTSIEFSKRSLNSNQRLDADIASIRAARNPRNNLWRNFLLDKETRDSVVSQLREAALAPQGQERARLDKLNGQLRDMAISSNGILQFATITIGDNARETLRLWKVSDNTPKEFEKALEESEIFPGKISHVTFSNGADQLAIATEKSSFHLWSIANNKLQTLKSPLGPIRKSIFNHNDSQLALIGENGNVSLWDISRKQPIELKKLPGTISEVAFNHDSSILAMVGEDGDFYLRRLADQTSQQVFKSPLGQVNKVVFNYDSSQLATLEKYGTVRLWNISSEDLSSEQPVELKGLQDYINTIEFSFDGSLFTGSVDGTVRLWDKDGNAIKEFKGHQGLVTNVAFKKNSEQFWTSDTRGTVRLWDKTPKSRQLQNNLSVHELLSMQCDWVRDYLTNEPNIEKSDRHLCDGIAAHTSMTPQPTPTPSPEPAPISQMLIRHTRQGANSGHTDTIVNYKTWSEWGGGNWTASIDATGQFTHTAQGATSSHNDVRIDYITWDGSEWTATLDPVSKVFTHTRKGTTSSHTDTRLDYITWDGSAWTMRLE